MLLQVCGLCDRPRAQWLCICCNLIRLLLQSSSASRPHWLLAVSLNVRPTDTCALLQVLVEGVYDKDPTLLTGRTDTSNRVCFPNSACPEYGSGGTSGPAWAMETPAPGTYVAVDITDATSGRLRGKALGRTALADFARLHGSCNPGMVAGSLTSGHAVLTPVAEQGGVHYS